MLLSEGGGEDQIEDNEKWWLIQTEIVPVVMAWLRS